MTRARIASIVAVSLAVLVALAWLRWPQQRAGVASVAPSGAPGAVATASDDAMGAYLARAGNCIGCHTRRGGQAYAGGQPIRTPFGTVYSTNLTPDPQTGLGRWSADDFWQALHHGVSRDGRLLTPAFPYPSYTRVTRADSDALFAYLQSLPPVVAPTPANALRWPYDSPLLLALWRRLYFEPGVHQPDPQRTPAFNRGAYLVEGLGHCGACHTARNRFGARIEDGALAGAQMPASDWTAPSLARAAGSDLGHWQPASMAQLLKTGVSPHGVASGPMLEVVRDSLQYLTDDDIDAIVTYLAEAPIPTGSRATSRLALTAGELPAAVARGAPLYREHCADCHGQDGAGVPPDYPALAGNPAVTMNPPSNLILTILHGGFSAATQGNPRPYGMPPFEQDLSDAEIADIVTYLRRSWGNRGDGIDALEVKRLR